MRLLASTWLALSLALLLAAPAGAQETRWKLGEEKLRYRHTPTVAPEPKAPNAPALPQHLLVDQSLFPDGRTPKRAVSDPGDLIWHYALTIPPPGGKKRGRGPRRIEVTDTFPIKGGELEVHGNHSIRVKGAKISVRSSLLVTCTAKKHWFKKGSLLLTSSYHKKRGRLERATYRFELQQSYETSATPPETRTRTDTWQGRIQTDTTVKVAAKGFHTGVQGAIDRGKAWLLKKTHERLNAYKALPVYPGQGLGKLALPVFALLRSGVAVKNLRGEFAWMTRQPLKETYSVSLWIMALEARSIRREARAPVARSRTVARFQRGKADPRDLAKMKRAVAWLLATRKAGEGWWSYYGPPPAKTDGGARGGPLGHDGKTPAKTGDRSNSQFAVLALHSAVASGIEIPAAVWIEIHQELVRSQQAKGPEVSLAASRHTPDSPLAFDPRDELVEPDRTYVRKKSGTAERVQARARGWAYANKRRAKPGAAYGSMASAGTSTAAIAREGLKKTGKLGPKRDRQSLAALRDGLAWLLHHYDVSRNTGRADNRWYYYYAYSLEKALDLAGVERLGHKEWWRDLSAELLALQQPDGSWGTVENTSFALLVLNRATLPVALELTKAGRVATGKLQAKNWDKVTVAGPKKERVELKVRQLLSAMATSPHDAAGRLELARRALAALDGDHRPRVIPELSELFRHPHKQTRKWARATCRALAGATDAAALEAFNAAWEEVRRIGAGLDHRKIPRLRELLAGPATATPLKRYVIKTLARLQAVEATGDLIGKLAHTDAGLRKHTWTWLISLLGTKHADYDPSAPAETRARQVEAWKAWWSGARTRLVESERAKRAVRDLSYPNRVRAGALLLTELGKPALRPLVDALRVEKTRAVAHGLLQKISKHKLPPQPEPWLAWLDAQDKKADR